VLVQQAIADSEHLDVSAHKAVESILRGTNDWFASDIEARVYEQ
jgi:hypothetical protein